MKQTYLFHQVRSTTSQSLSRHPRRKALLNVWQRKLVTRRCTIKATLSLGKILWQAQKTLVSMCMNRCLLDRSTVGTKAKNQRSRTITSDLRASRRARGFCLLGYICEQTCVVVAYLVEPFLIQSLFFRYLSYVVQTLCLLLLRQFQSVAFCFVG